MEVEDHLQLVVFGLGVLGKRLGVIATWAFADTEDVSRHASSATPRIHERSTATRNSPEAVIILEHLFVHLLEVRVDTGTAHRERTKGLIHRVGVGSGRVRKAGSLVCSVSSKRRGCGTYQ